VIITLFFIKVTYFSCLTNTLKTLFSILQRNRKKIHFFFINFKKSNPSVLVNGSPTDEFQLKRGLRQGDPLSPFLFLLAAEGFNILMKSMVDNHLFHGYKVGSDVSTVVSHLQFADDTLIIAEKSWANVRAMRAVLILFEAISGLKVNFNKS